MAVVDLDSPYVWAIQLTSPDGKIFDCKLAPTDLINPPYKTNISHLMVLISSFANVTLDKDIESYIVYKNMTPELYEVWIDYISMPSDLKRRLSYSIIDTIEHIKQRVNGWLNKIYDDPDQHTFIVQFRDLWEYISKIWRRKRYDSWLLSRDEWVCLDTTEKRSLALMWNPQRKMLVIIEPRIFHRCKCNLEVIEDALSVIPHADDLAAFYGYEEGEI